MSLKVGYQGIEGAYSEAAVLQHFTMPVACTGFESFEEVFEAVVKGVITYGVIPVENSIAGSITMNYDLLVKEPVEIVGEIFLKINHNLLGQKGAKLQQIKKVYSHQTALEQCKGFIKKHHLKAIPEYDTAGAAKIIKERNNQDEVVVASDLAAKIYDLDILAENIEDNKHNSTRFFVIAKKDASSIENIKREKTSIAFKTKHYPGALVNGLQRLAKHNINMTKLESRPIPETPWEYLFYIDFEGGIDDENVKLALSEVEATCEYFKVLGSYPKGKI